MDLILRGATLADSRKDQDMGIANGCIVAIEPELAAAAPEEIDVAGNLVSAPFVDAHFRLPERSAEVDFRFRSISGGVS